MHKYRSMTVWQRSHALVLAYHPRSRALFDQLRRAAISVEANLVEGYALGTPLQFRRHLRIAIGSAAETECLMRTADEMGYLPNAPVQEMAGSRNTSPRKNDTLSGRVVRVPPSNPHNFVA